MVECGMLKVFGIIVDGDGGVGIERSVVLLCV